MARFTFVRQDAAQRSDSFDDTITPTEANFETNPVTLEDDLNNLRSAIQTLLGKTNWFDVSDRSVEGLDTDLGDLEAKPIICGVDVLTDIAVAAGVAATGTLTGTANFADTETVTIDAKVYTFQTTLTDVDGNVFIGVDLATSLDNLRAAVNLDAGAGSAYAASTTLHPTVSATDTATTVVATAKKQGTFGNTIATTETATNASWGAATLAGGAGDVHVLSVSGSEAPTDTAGVSGGQGAVVAVLATDVGTADLTEEAGANALTPKNLVTLRDAVTKDAIVDASGQEIFGLLQAETGVLQGEAFTDTTKQAQITFVVNNGSDDLVSADGVDIGGLTIEYMYGKRVTLDTLPDNCNWPPKFSDQTASVDVTRQAAYNNQGTTPVDLTTNAILDLEGPGLAWRIRDDLEAVIFEIVEGSAGGTTQFNIPAAVDEFDVDAAINDFLNGASFDTGAAGTTIDIGVTLANNITSGGLLRLLSTGADLSLAAGDELNFTDTYRAGSTWSLVDGVSFADSSAEWDSFETNFGEVSLLNAINQSFTTANFNKTVAVLTSTTTADNDVGGVGGGTNLDVQIHDLSGGSFLTDHDIFLNGQLLRNGADAAANFDVYPGTSLANGQLKFEFTVTAGGNADVITVVSRA